MIKQNGYVCLRESRTHYVTNDPERWTYRRSRMKMGPFHQKIPWRHHLGFGMWSQTHTHCRNDFHLQKQAQLSVMDSCSQLTDTITCLQDIIFQYKPWSKKGKCFINLRLSQALPRSKPPEPRAGKCAWTSAFLSCTQHPRTSSPSLNVSSAHNITLLLFFVVKLHVNQAHKHSLIRVYGGFGAWMSKCRLWSRQDSRSLQELFIKNTHV